MHRRIVMIALAAVIIAPGCAQTQPSAPIDPDLLKRNARQTLINHTTNPSPLLRCHAIEAIAQSRQADAMEFVVAALGDDYPGVRFAACLAIISMRWQGGAKMLLTTVNDSNGSVRAAAAGALHTLGDARYTSLIGKAITDPDVTVRRNAAMVLGAMGQPAAIRVLKQASRDDDISVRLQATEAMAVLGSKRSQRLMRTYCQSVYDDESIMAMMVLARSAKKKTLTGDDREVASEQIADIFERTRQKDRLGMRLVAARALAMLDDNRGQNVALESLHFKSQDPNQVARIRKLAVLALAEMPDRAIIPQLALLLDDGDPDVRIAAAMAVLRALDGVAGGEEL